jgi:crossover junction endodeoxyribonuclease RusA
VRISLPFPEKVLWPNGPRSNRYAVARAKKAARHAASWATIQARQEQGVPDFGDGKVEVRLIVHANRFGPLPDEDNCVAAMKSMLDGIAQEIGVNDRRFLAPKVDFAAPRNGTIIVVLSPACGRKTYQEHSPNSDDSAMKKIGPGDASTSPARDPNAFEERIG